MPSSRAPRRTFAGAAAAAGAAVLLRTRAGAAQYDWKLGTNYSREHPVSVSATQMCEAIGRESGGRIRMQFFPDASLGGDDAVLAQVRLGAIQMTIINPGSLSSLFKVAGITSIGFVFKDADEAMRVMDGPLGTHICRDATGVNLYMFAESWDAGMIHIGAIGRPIRTPEDLHGFKVRVVPSKINVDLFTTFGAVPVAMSFNQIYTSLQTRLLDGEAAPLPSILTYHIYELNKYVSLTNHSWGGTWNVMNGEAFKALPSDLQEVLVRNNRKYCLAARRSLRLLNLSVADKLTRLGITLNPVDQTPFRARLRPYFQEWASQFGSEPWKLLEAGVGRSLT